MRTIADKLKLLRLFDRHGNVSRACREAGFSRDSFYRIFDRYQRLGRAGLKPAGGRGPASRIAPQVVAEILRIARDHPELGKRAVSSLLAESLEIFYTGVALFKPTTSPNGVRQVWLRHGLTTMERRTAWALKQGRRKKVKKKIGVWKKVACPFCHRSFLVTGEPPYTCPRCRGARS